MNKKLIGFVGIFVLIDQLVKYVVRTHLRLYDTISVIPHFFKITYVTNTGGAFSLFQGNLWFFILISIVLLLVFLFSFKNVTMDSFSLISYSLIMGGIVGNFIDRVFLGFVVDFLSFQIFHYYFPVFNIADIGIVVGVFLIVGRDCYARIGSRRDGEERKG